MKMGEAIIRGLIGLCLLVLAVFIAFWVISALGIHLPDMVEKIVWIIVALVAVLIFYRSIKASGASWLP